MNLSHLRCFWRWPPGHRWEIDAEQEYAVKRCRTCGKTTPLSSWAKQRSPGKYTGHRPGHDPGRFDNYP